VPRESPGQEKTLPARWTLVTAIPRALSTLKFRKLSINASGMRTTPVRTTLGDLPPDSQAGRGVPILSEEFPRVGTYNPGKLEAGSQGKRIDQGRDGRVGRVRQPPKRMEPIVIRLRHVLALQQ
jgi:hypothetical protein